MLHQISEFCHELKKLATRVKEREDAEKLNQKKSPPMKPAVKEVVSEGPNDKGMERKPLLEVGKESSRTIEKKTKLRKK